MSALIREHDWGSTPLGPIAGWTGRLRGAVDSCLSLPMPAVVAWGSELTIIYNDAAIHYLGGRHPGALGRAASRNWAPIWPGVAPLVQEVLSSGKGKRIAEIRDSAPPADGTEPVVFSLILNPLRHDDGAVAGVLVVANDITERKHAEQVRRRNEERLRLALEVGELGVFEIDLEGEGHNHSEDLVRMLGYEPGEIDFDQDVLWAHIHRDDLPIADAANASAMQMQRLYPHEYRVVRRDGEVRWWQVQGRFFNDERGDPVRILGVVRDVTETRQAEETQKLLIAELQHRTRNLLAVVGATARRTLQASDSLKEFASKFEERLSALSRVQGLLSRVEGQPVRLRELVESELQAHGVGLDDPRVTIRRAQVRLPSRAVQTLALAIHELATNAVKYGALSQDQAKLSVSWHVSTEEGHRVAHIRWSEMGVAVPEVASARRGFGRQLLENALPYELKARTSWSLTPDGVRCEIALVLLP